MAGEMIVNVGRKVTGLGLTTGGTEQKILVDAGLPIKKTIPGGSAPNAHFVVAVDVSAVKVISIECDKDCSIFTNAPSTGSPADTLAMLAGVPKTWVIGDDAALFLTVDVTGFYVTVGTSDTKLTMIIGYDSTPVLADV